MQAQRNRFSPFALPATNQAVSIAQRASPGKLSLVASNVAATLPIDQQLADAFNANNDVMAYVIGITETVLPTLPSPPKWYPPFQTAFSNAQIHANGWYSIATNLVSIPNSIVGYGIAFNSNMATINSLLGVLHNDPKNKPAIDALKNTLGSMLAQLRTYSQSAVDFKKTIDSFANNLKSDANTMSEAVTESRRSAEVEQNKVKEFEDLIRQMKDKVATWQTVQTAAAIGAGVGFWLGAVIAIFSLGFGIAFGCVALGAGIALVIAADVEMRQLRFQIQQKTNDMNDATKAAASLTALSSQVNSLIALSQAASKQVGLVTEAWQVLEEEITTVINDLQRAANDVSPLNLQQLQLELNLANQDWQTLVSFCSTIAAIKYNQATPPVAELKSA
ncbi:HBL/NHE enterotoxin family protein [Pseudoduganella eburnea]|uniref:HBL/NHE enterotoxin family protein n=1 Tax=Massilia eburnea TaxID=1776165 RepID=A0A6L6QPK6_9BURK|nr:HBL/NHE enterotoxin family protein [Massilia eburnea]MTW14289.1 HBL/NHE enterotoxin family protein [Massilia eburnea]